MNKKTIAIILIAAGIGLLALSLGADVLGIGGRAGFGWKQQAAAALGVLVAIMGIWLSRR